MHKTILSAVSLLLVFGHCFSASGAEAPAWSPAKGPLMTRWAKDVSPQKVHPEYPRPQMVRKEWLNLNGLWDYSIRDRAKKVNVDSYDGKILVPFCAESALSGVMKRVGPDKLLWYHRTFEVPKAWTGKRVLLHFGAVDWQARVWVNKKEIGIHRGGYDPFTFDITGSLRPEGPQDLFVCVWDPTDKGPQPRGKQVSNPRGIWYSPVTGIWRTVWLEPVPKAHIRSLTIVPDVDKQAVRITVGVPGAGKGAAITIRRAGKTELKPVAGKPNSEIVVPVASPHLWSPGDPYLYEIDVVLLRGAYDSMPADSVRSYFGMRKIEVAKDDAGVNRLLLNGKVLFQLGPLDQGWWPDGLYTAPTDEALRYDVEVLKKLGMNMIRKHVKVEPDRWYYHCDKLGMLVWQDMPNGKGPGEKRKPDESGAVMSQFDYELKNVIEAFRNHPSIVMWVPFNEGWGQHDAGRIVAWIKRMDPTRLVNHASGWKDKGVGDVKDIHKYPGPGMAKLEEKRAVVLGEFGGLGLPVKGHLWWNKKNWGYRNFKTREELTAAYVNLMRRLHPLIGQGLAAAVYTQTTDVEGEVNGLMTYDRAMVKPDAEAVAKAHRRLYLPPPVIRTVVPASRKDAQQWRYTTAKPPDGWQKPDFDDTKWKSAPGGFGAGSTPGVTARTRWTTGNIWLRRIFTLDKSVKGDLQLLIYHDEDARVYLDGKRVAAVSGYSTAYGTMPMAGVSSLGAGRHTLAVHCRQTRGGQYIDVGIVAVEERK